MVLIKFNFKHTEISSCSLSDEGKIVFFGDSLGNLRMLCYKKTYKSLKSLKLHELEITKIANINEKLVSCSRDSKLKLWDIYKQKVIKTFIGHHGPITEMDILENCISSTSEDGDLRLWDIRTKESIEKIKHGYNLLGCKFLNNQNLILTYGVTNSLYIWDLRMKHIFLKHSKILKNPNSYITSLCVSKITNFIFILDSDYKLHRIHARLKKDYKHFKIFPKNPKKSGSIGKVLLKLNLDKEEKFILNGDLSGKTYVRLPKNGKIVSQFNDHVGPIREVLYNATKKIIISCGIHGSVVLKSY